MLSKVRSYIIKGIDAVPVTIETDIGRGMPSLNITGLADTTIREAQLRVRAAIVNSGYEFPTGRIIVNIAPADIRKKGSSLDLALGIGILMASGQIKAEEIDDYIIAGELSLDGTVSPVAGILNISEAALKEGKKTLVPYCNRDEAALMDGARIIPAHDLREVAAHLSGSALIHEYIGRDIGEYSAPTYQDFSDVKGQEFAKRALTVAAAGGHCVLMTGSPGTGKTMLAERLPGILPELTHDEMIRATEVYSVAGLLDEESPYICERPFRSPHHSITEAGLLGGGRYPRPGEITLANKGVLFLDEFAEFDRNVIDTLREPLEHKKVSLVRNGETVRFPSDFMLIAATNPCKCGYLLDPKHECTCTPGDIARYRAKISGPILDRIDIHIVLSTVSYVSMDQEHVLGTAEMKDMVYRARDTQDERFRGMDISLNSDMTDKMVKEMANMSKGAREMAGEAFDRLRMSPRTLIKTIKIARTIADMEGTNEINESEIAEAVRYSRFSSKDMVI